MGLGTLKQLKVAGPVGVALGGAGLYFSTSFDEGTRRALSMYAAFGMHASAVQHIKVLLQLLAQLTQLAPATTQVRSWRIIAGWKPSTRG